MSIRLRRTLYVGLAALMVASTCGSSVSNISANAKSRRPRISRYVKSRKRMHNRAHRNSLRIKSGKYSSARAPWRKAWNKYTKGFSIWVNNRIFNANLSNKRRKASGAPQSRSYWDKFFNNHRNNKRSFTSSTQITYPQYYRLVTNDANMHYQLHRHTYALVFPALYNHLGNDHYHMSLDNTRNADLLANMPLKDYTPHMLRAWRSVSVPAHNNQRVLTSFSKWMKRTHNHPQLNIGKGHVYTFNNESFVPNKGTNGYGTTYAFNPKTNHYQRVNTKKVINKVTKNVQSTENQLENTKEKQMLEIINSPILTANTKDVCLQAMIGQPSGNTQQDKNTLQNQTSPVQAYKTAAKSSQVSPAQTTRLDYMVNSILHGHDISKPVDSNAKRDVLYLDVHGAFQSMSNNKRSALINKLIYDPSLMSKYLRAFGARNSVDITQHPQAEANKVNATAADGNSIKNSNGIITNDPTLAQTISIMQKEVQQLANNINVNLPNNTKNTQF